MDTCLWGGQTKNEKKKNWFTLMYILEPSMNALYSRIHSFSHCTNSNGPKSVNNEMRRYVILCSSNECCMNLCSVNYYVRLNSVTTTQHYTQLMLENVKCIGIHKKYSNEER